MSFQKKSLRPGRDRRECQHRNELACAAAGALGTLSRPLHAMGGVEYHRRSTGITKSSERTHVDDKIAIGEECSTFGYGNVARAAVGVHSAANFLHRAAHSFRLQPLASLDVDGFARRTGGFEQIGLATEECRDLEHINNTRRGRALFRRVDIGKNR